MPFNTNIDTTDLEQVERLIPNAGPPLDLTPTKSPYYIGQMPTTANVNPDAVRNFATPGLPFRRITPAAPLNVAGSVINAVAGVTTAAVVLQPVPAPTISSPLATIPTGYQFSFLQVRLPLSSTSTNTINSYKIYRSSSNNTTSATVIQSIPHHPANIGVPVVVQDAVTNGQTRFYFVSAVNISGVESTLTPAQSGAVTNNAGFNSNSQLASTFHGNAVNTSLASTDLVTLGNNGSTNTVTITANTNQFAPGQVNYNSGSVNPGSFGTWVIFADDPTFTGGPVIYNFSSLVYTQAAAEGRILLGKITTAVTSAVTSGGYTGGTTGPSGIGGRGVIQQ